MEEFRKLQNYYSVSNMGNVLKTRRILKPRINNKGYHSVILYTKMIK